MKISKKQKYIVKYWPELINEIKRDNPNYAVYLHQCPICLASLVKDVNEEIYCYGGDLMLYRRHMVNKAKESNYKAINHWTHEAELMVCELIPFHYKNEYKDEDDDYEEVLFNNNF